MAPRGSPGQDQPVGGHHGGIEAERREPRLLGRVLQRGGGADRKAERLGARLHRRRLDAVAAAGRARRLRIDGGNLVPGRRQRLQDRHGETGRAHEGEAHHIADSAFAFCALASLRMMMLRFSADR